MLNLRIPEQTNLNADIEIDWTNGNFKFLKDTEHGIDDIYIQVVESSSEDYDQIADNLLGTVFHKKKETFGNFWSSDGSLEDSCNDHIIFCSRIENSEVLLIDRIDILFHVEACHTYPKNIYFSNKVRISIGYIEGEWDLQKEVDLSGMEYYLRKGFIPVEFDEHIFVRYILVEFIGKPCNQVFDNLYYLSVSRVNFYGRVYDLSKCKEIVKRLTNMYNKNEKKKVQLENFVKTKIIKYFHGEEN